MLFTLLLSLLSQTAHADSATVLNCPRDTNGDRLYVSYSSGEYRYAVRVSSNVTVVGTLDKTGRDLALLTGDDIRIEVPRLEYMDIPSTETRVTYRFKDEPRVHIVCKKGSRYSSLFEDEEE